MNNLRDSKIDKSHMLVRHSPYFYGPSLFYKPRHGQREGTALCACAEHTSATARFIVRHCKFVFVARSAQKQSSAIVIHPPPPFVSLNAAGVARASRRQRHVKGLLFTQSLMSRTRVIYFSYMLEHVFWQNCLARTGNGC